MTKSVGTKIDAKVNRLFPTNLPELEWVEFSAHGFSEPVSGVIHRTAHPALCGMPLGSIGTGCIDLDTNGTFGYSTIFNSHVPRGGPLNLPFLGVSIGQESWILSSQPIRGDLVAMSGVPGSRRAQGASEIHYWGHYPIADLEFDIDAPVSVGLRAWAPFIPGDTIASNTPGAVFEVHIRNLSDSAQKGVLVFSFPGPSPQEAQGSTIFRHLQVRQNYFSGVAVINEIGIGYALGVAGNERFRAGGDLGTDGGAWSRIADGPWFAHWGELPTDVSQAGVSLAVDFEVKREEEKVTRFVLAWYSPEWKGGGAPMAGGNTYAHMYASRFTDAADVARFLAENQSSLLGRVLAWQQIIYTEKRIPVWLRESLVNMLHLITEDGFWAQAKPPIGKWCRPEDGLFGMSECPRGCPQIECIPCSFYGNLPLVYFFPELALSTLRGYKAYQYPSGAAPWIFGGATCGEPPCEMAMPCRGYDQKPQTTLDGPCYVDMVDRMWLRTGDQKLLAEFYDSVKRNTIFTMNLRPGSGPAGIVSMPAGNNGQDWYEACELLGIVPHIGGAHLANLRMAERMAEQMGDKEFAQQCTEWLTQGSRVLEEQTWAGGNYLLYCEPETGKRSEVVMGQQLDGEWMARSHGLQGVFRQDRVRKTLGTLKGTNVTERGSTVFKLPKEGEFNPGYWTTSGIHVPGSLMQAMTYMYSGERDFGLELAYRTMRTLILEIRGSWDSILLFRGDTGEKLAGNDYYQNLMLWFLPAAVDNADLREPCKPGGLVYRILEAAKAK